MEHRERLPQLDGKLFLTDGGIETTLIFHEGLDLPYFAAFHILQTPEGVAVLREYFRTYAEIAKRYETGLVLESATWRASVDWGDRLGYSTEALTQANRRAVELLTEIREEFETENTPVVISGCIGPRGDGYLPDQAMSPAAAEAYHMVQVETFAAADADMACAITMNYTEEAIGIVQATKRAGLPVAISFTVEPDGNLPTGQLLRAAIEQVDKETSGYASYFMINCAHPTHFDHVLPNDEPWLERIRGLRANASRKSHAELNEATELDTGDPIQLAREYAQLRERLTKLTVLGGCCGTDHRHIEQIASTWLSA